MVSFHVEYHLPISISNVATYMGYIGLMPVVPPAITPGNQDRPVHSC